MVDLVELRVKVSQDGADDAADEVEDAAQSGTEQGGGGLSEGLTPEAPEQGGEGLTEGLIPETDGLMDSISGIGEQISGSVSGIGGAAGGGISSGISGILGSMSTAVMGILGGIAAIAGILLSMEPIQKMLSAFMKIIQAFFLPLAKVIIKLLSPVMKALIKLLPKWLSFWQDPIGNIKKAVKFIWNALKQVPSAIISILSKLPSMIWDFLKEGFNIISDAIGNLPSSIASAIKGALSPEPPSDEEIEEDIEDKGRDLVGKGTNYIEVDPVPDKVEGRARGQNVDTREFKVPKRWIRWLDREAQRRGTSREQVVVNMDPDQRELYGIKVKDPNTETGGR